MAMDTGEPWVMMDLLELHIDKVKKKIMIWRRCYSVANVIS